MLCKIIERFFRIIYPFIDRSHHHLPPRNPGPQGSHRSFLFCILTSHPSDLSCSNMKLTGCTPQAFVVRFTQRLWSALPSSIVCYFIVCRLVVYIRRKYGCCLSHKPQLYLYWGSNRRQPKQVLRKQRTPPSATFYLTKKSLHSPRGLIYRHICSKSAK